MLAVLYSFKLKPEQESIYPQLWQELAHFFITEKGALGSCLHQAENGIWIAYSRWPDAQTRAAAWRPDEKERSDLPARIRQILQDMENCAEETYPEVVMHVKMDFLNSKPIV